MAGVLESLNDRFRYYRAIFEAAREIVDLLERESFDGLDAAHARRQAAMDYIDGLGPLSAEVVEAARPVLTPLLLQIERLDAQAAMLLHQHRVRVLAHAAAMPALPSRVNDGPRFFDRIG